jgi:Methylase involved in ubiquinone/menaquinone biosynthesis
MNKIATAFNEIAVKYDQQRRFLIPCYDDFYKIIVELSESQLPNPRILDIGAGTGLLTSFLISKFPKTQFTLIDFSDEMLNVARQRFEGMDNISYIASDYKGFVEQEQYDIIVSALSIHHLSNAEKSSLYRGIYQSLAKGGAFINGDQFLARSQETEDWYHKLWVDKIESTSLSEKEKLAAYERMKLDVPATVEDNLHWLEAAGFANPDLFYKYYCFGVIRGLKR